MDRRQYTDRVLTSLRRMTAKEREAIRSELDGHIEDHLEALREAVSCRIVASGGVSCNGDLQKLQAMGLYGAIIGKAYYAGKVDLARAVWEVQP